MSTRKRQKKRKARSRKNKHPAVTLKTDSIPQKPKTPVEDKAQSNTTPKAPPTKDVIINPKSTSENNDSAKILLDGESDNDQSDEVVSKSTDEKPSQIRAAQESSGKGWLKTKKYGRYFITTIEVIAAAFVIPTAFVLIIDLEDRQSQAMHPRS